MSTVNGTMSNDKISLSALKNALDSMTPGPWHRSNGGQMVLSDHHEERGVVCRIAYVTPHEDAGGIAALRNAADTLIAAVKATLEWQTASARRHEAADAMASSKNAAEYNAACELMGPAHRDEIAARERGQAALAKVTP